MEEHRTRELLVRECDCPPWVIRCAHEDGDVRIAIVSLETHLSAERCPIEPACHLGPEYQLLVGIEAFEPCAKCEKVLKGTGIATSWDGFDDLNAAQEAFDRAIESMRGS